MSSQNMREAFNSLIAQGHIIGFNDFQTGWEARVALVQCYAHPDDEAVDVFAAEMKSKLALARSKGRGGWQTCSPDDLSRMLREHVEKSDPCDVANFCMFLWSLGSGIAKSDAQEPAVCLVGIKGSAFDAPKTKRAYTYAEQPGNVVASKLGGACAKAGSGAAGDNIDRGLSLLKALQDVGFGVFAIGAEYTAAPSREVPARFCQWHKDGEYSNWHGACGAAWRFDDGGPVENEMNFCPQCGGRVLLDNKGANHE